MEKRENSFYYIHFVLTQKRIKKVKASDKNLRKYYGNHNTMKRTRFAQTTFHLTPTLLP